MSNVLTPSEAALLKTMSGGSIGVAWLLIAEVYDAIPLPLGGDEWAAFPVTLRFASIPINPLESEVTAEMPVATHIPGVLGTVAEVQRQIPGDENGYTGFVTQAAMRLELQNTDGELDELPTLYQWRDRRIQLKAALTQRASTGHQEVAPLLADFLHQYDGRCVNLEVDRDHTTITVEEGVKRLERQVQTNLYAGTGGVNGGEDLSGLPIPLAYGTCPNVTPTIVDQVLLIGQVHETEVKSIQVYDRRIALQNRINVSTYDDLVALIVRGEAEEGVPVDLDIGEFATCLSSGHFRLGGMPVGIVTADVEGDGGGGGVAVWDFGAQWAGGAQWAQQGTFSHASLLGAIAQRLLLRLGFTNEINSTSFNQFDTTYPYEVGIYISSSTRPTGREILTRLTISGGAIITRNRLGTMDLLALESPAVTQKFDITHGMVATDGLDWIALPYGAAWPTIRVQYNLNWTLMTADNLDVTVSATERAFVTRESSFIEKTNNETKALLPDRPPLIIDSLLVNISDANAVAGRLLVFYSRSRQLYSVRVRGISFILELLDTVKIFHSRFGLTNGRNMLVMRIVERPASYETELHLFG